MLSEAILAESQAIEFTRAGTPSSSYGRVVPGTPSTFSANAAVQPLSPRERLLLPEGERTKEKIKIYSTTQLRIGSPDAGTIGDRFTHNGVLFEVDAEAAWSGDGSHYRYWATKVER